MSPKKKAGHAPQVMVDLETLGTRPGSVIVALGAVKFSWRNGLGDTFYHRIDPASCVAAGLTMDAATVVWWLKQPDAARRELTRPGAPLAAVLTVFSAWLEARDVEVWGNGPAFDNGLLAEAYARVQLPLPWRYPNDRCYRTLKSLRPRVGLHREGEHHHALADARTQALHLIRVMRALKKGKA